ncbi:MAG: hypothetical protein ACFE9D_01115 [Promethearchaeota archaeon]
MNAEELMKKYHQLSTKPMAVPSLENESGESVETLYQSSSLRILLIRTTADPENVTLEVEVWLPGSYSDDDLTSLSKTEGKTQNEKLGEMLGQMITHLQYLYSLHQSGFSLDVIKHDCLWTASCTFSKLPDRELFDRLLPP